jgi:hypothetical protein
MQLSFRGISAQQAMLGDALSPRLPLPNDFPLAAWFRSYAQDRTEYLRTSDDYQILSFAEPRPIKTVLLGIAGETISTRVGVCFCEPLGKSLLRLVASLDST